MKKFEVVSVRRYIVRARDYEDAVDKAIDGEYIEYDEDFPDPRGWGQEDEEDEEVE